MLSFTGNNLIVSQGGADFVQKVVSKRTYRASSHTSAADPAMIRYQANGAKP